MGMERSGEGETARHALYRWHNRGALSMKHNRNVVVSAPHFYKLDDSSSRSALEKGAIAAQPPLRFLASDTHRTAVHDSLRASPPPPLLHCSDYQRLNLQTSAHKQCPGARGAAEFVARNRQSIRSQVHDVDGNFACRLARVHVHQSTNLMGGIANFTNRLHYTCFVLHKHDRDHAGVGCEGGRKRLHINQSVWKHPNNRDRMTCWL